MMGVRGIAACGDGMSMGENAVLKCGSVAERVEAISRPTKYNGIHLKWQSDKLRVKRDAREDVPVIGYLMSNIFALARLPPAVRV